jgi:hypothetical protein
MGHVVQVVGGRVTEHIAGNLGSLEDANDVTDLVGVFNVVEQGSPGLWAGWEGVRGEATSGRFLVM